MKKGWGWAKAREGQEETRGEIEEIIVRELERTCKTSGKEGRVKASKKGAALEPKTKARERAASGKCGEKELATKPVQVSAPTQSKPRKGAVGS